MTDAPALDAPDLPPLWRGVAAAAGADPFAHAIELVVEDGEPGRLVWAVDADALRLAVTLAPEVALTEALPAIPAVALAVIDALGALAPPETAVHIRWPGEIRVNGARAGRIRAAAPVLTPEAPAAWLVVGAELALSPSVDDPGDRVDETSLPEEGVGVAPRRIVEAFARHALVWINRLVDDGPVPILRAWRVKLDDVAPSADHGPAGRLIDLDPRGGARIARDSREETLPLTLMLEAP